MLQNVQFTGFMTEKEKECYEAVKTEVNIYWLPGLWFTHYLQEARRQGQVKDAHGVKLIMEVYQSSTKLPTIRKIWFLVIIFIFFC